MADVSGRGNVGTINLPIHEFLGVEFLGVSPTLAVAKFQVSQASMQYFGALHGGVSALVTESIGSTAAAVAAGGAAVLGLEVTCSHLKGGTMGTDIVAVAKPMRAGKLVQVWEVRFYAVPKGDRPGRIQFEKVLQYYKKYSGPIEDAPLVIPAEVSDLVAKVEVAENLLAVGRLTVLIRRGEKPRRPGNVEERVGGPLTFKDLFSGPSKNPPQSRL